MALVSRAWRPRLDSVLWSDIDGLRCIFPEGGWVSGSPLAGTSASVRATSTILKLRPRRDARRQGASPEKATEREPVRGVTVSGDGEVPRPRRAAPPRRSRVSSLPAGISRARARAGSDPDHETTGVTSAGFRGCRTSVRRGVAHSPRSTPGIGERDSESATETQRGQRVSRTLTSQGYAHKYARKARQTYLRTNVAPRVTPMRANYSPEAGDRSPPG